MKLIKHEVRIAFYNFDALHRWSFTSADVVVSEIYQEAKDVGLIGAGKSLIKLFPVLEEDQQEIMQMQNRLQT